MADPVLQDLVQQLLREMSQLGRASQLPVVISKKRAARELSISLSKLKGMIRCGEIMACEVGSTTMVPASEVYRLARPRSTAPLPRPSRPRGKAAQHSPAEEARKVRESLKSKPRRPKRAP